MQLRWAIGIALWTTLSAPIFGPAISPPEVFRRWNTSPFKDHRDPKDHKDRKDENTRGRTTKVE